MSHIPTSPLLEEEHLYYKALPRPAFGGRRFVLPGNIAVGLPSAPQAARIVARYSRRRSQRSWRNRGASEELRGRAAIAPGPVLEEMDLHEPLGGEIDELNPPAEEAMTMANALYADPSKW